MHPQGPLAAEYVAKLAAASSAGIAGITWIATLNDVLQLIATAIAIIAGVYAVRWHKFRLDQGRKHLDKEHRAKQIVETIKELEDEPEEDRYVRDGEDVHR
jgi:hypothetical protein